MVRVTKGIFMLIKTLRFAITLFSMPILIIFIIVEIMAWAVMDVDMDLTSAIIYNLTFGSMQE